MTSVTYKVLGEYYFYTGAFHLSEGLRKHMYSYSCFDHISVTGWLDYLFNIAPFTKKETMPNSKYLPKCLKIKCCMTPPKILPK